MIILKLFFIVFLLSTLLCSSKLSAEEVWKIASLNWQPYAGEELPDHGSSIKILRELLKQAGITLVVEFYPWSRAKHLVRANTEYVGIFPAWPEDIFDGAIISPAIDWSIISILKRKATVVNFNSIDQIFENYSIGVVNNYLYPKIFADAIKQYPESVEGAPNELSLLRKLAVGRGDVAITDPNVMFYLAKQQGIFDIEVVKHVMKKELILAFRDDVENRKRLELLTKLQKIRLSR
ncbi:substrate-binding periplasmic protein [Colwellia psychrerythraea]|uniref:ABC-type transporter, periplasmic subunit family 3 n=1 Tax=Colwellia psychrerythraea TaxID=28229 RepID=A0A099KD33_COLPS|nr:hypothetical protein [Colwellia psychrerythraea]KGJ88286.1 hypothetical protein ND2E_4122 [Colwellia psychrerythraea]